MLEILRTVKKSNFEKTQIFYQICQILHFCSLTDFRLSILVKGNIIHNHLGGIGSRLATKFIQALNIKRPSNSLSF